MKHSPSIEAALEPVRTALLSAAQRDAQRVRTAGAAAAAWELSQAQQRAAAISIQARVQGEADAAAARTAAEAGARRHARTIVLQAQREAFVQLRDAVRTDLARLQGDPAYAALRSGLAGTVSRSLGADAVIRDADGGGVVGEVAGRRMDCSLRSFADRAVTELGWTLFDETDPETLADTPAERART